MTPSRKTAREILNTDLYCITSEEHSSGRDNIQVTESLLSAGIRLIQYREKEKTMGEKYRQCQRIRELTRRVGAFLIVNDHADLALAVAADGVHIGQEDLPIEAVRQVVGDRMIIGVSTHSPDQARDAVERGADYIGVGPIYRTFTKKDVCEPVGLGYLDHVVSGFDIPFVAIGGIKTHNLAEVVRHGAGCISLVTEIVSAGDIGARIRELRAIMRQTTPSPARIES
ncbi:MAG: thiamine phosphate synthase [Thermodesulfobacteriota bacterium]